MIPNATLRISAIILFLPLIIFYRSPYLTPRVGLGGLNQTSSNSMQAMAKRFKPNNGGPSLSPTTTGEILNNNNNGSSRRSSYEQVSTPTNNQNRRGSAPVTPQNTVINNINNNNIKREDTESGQKISKSGLIRTLRIILPRVVTNCIKKMFCINS